MFERIGLRVTLFAAASVFATAASAADLTPPPSLFDWSGLYIGVHAGGVWGGGHDKGCKAFKDLVGEGGGLPDFSSAAKEGCKDISLDRTLNDIGSDVEPKAPFFELDDDYVAVTKGGGGNSGGNFLIGPQIGINQQYGSLVVGLEADYSWVGGGNGQHIDFEYYHSIEYGGDSNELYNFQGTGKVRGGDLDFIATFRGKLGMAVGDQGRGMIYGTGGLALAGVNGLKGTFDNNGVVKWCDDECVFGKSSSSTHVGYAIGIGGEWAFTDTLSVAAEFLHLGFNNDNNDRLTFYADDGRQFSFDNRLDSLNVAQVKLNVRFPPH